MTCMSYRCARSKIYNPKSGLWGQKYKPHGSFYSYAIDTTQDMTQIIVSNRLVPDMASYRAWVNCETTILTMRAHTYISQIRASVSYWIFFLQIQLLICTLIHCISVYILVLCSSCFILLILIILHKDHVIIFYQLLPTFSLIPSCSHQGMEEISSFCMCAMTWAIWESRVPMYSQKKP